MNGQDLAPKGTWAGDIDAAVLVEPKAVAEEADPLFSLVRDAMTIGGYVINRTPFCLRQKLIADYIRERLHAFEACQPQPKVTRQIILED